MPKVSNKKLDALFALEKDTRELVGRAVAEFTRQHFLVLNKQRHRGLYLKGFYARAADTISYQVKDQSVEFTVSQLGIAQRYYGGTIVPKKAKALAIPNWKEIAATATHGPTEFKGLKFVKFPSGAMALVQGDTAATLGGKKVKGAAKKPLRIFFWLVKSVTQKPDPSVLPSKEDLGDVAYKVVKARFDQIMKQSGT